MMKFRENEDAVSPVIGVILMVAITVILAAVIAAFVFGMGSSVQSTKTVGLTLQKSGDNLTVTIAGGPDLPELQCLKVTFNGDGAVYSQGEGYTMNTTTKGSARVEGNEFKVGDIFRTGDGQLKNSTRVIVVGHFSDGQEQMLADRHF